MGVIGQKTILPTVKTAGRITINFAAVEMGKDLCVVVCGGDRPHLGAAALAQCRSSLAETQAMSASVSVLTLLGHKEDRLAAKVAKRLAKSLGANVAVLCGIHVDDIAEREIEAVLRMVDEWCEAYLQSTF